MLFEKCDSKLDLAQSQYGHRDVQSIIASTMADRWLRHRHWFNDCVRPSLCSVEPAVFFKQLQLSALADIRTHTGQEPLPGSLRGFSYAKKWPNGRQARLEITDMEPNKVYAYTLATPQDDFRVSYRLVPLASGKSRLEYEESLVAKTARGTANNRVSGLLMGWFRKRRFKKMALKMCQS